MGGFIQCLFYGSARRCPQIFAEKNIEFTKLTKFQPYFEGTQLKKLQNLKIKNI